MYECGGRLRENWAVDVIQIAWRQPKEGPPKPDGVEWSKKKYVFYCGYPFPCAITTKKEDPITRNIRQVNDMYWKITGELFIRRLELLRLQLIIRTVVYFKKSQFMLGISYTLGNIIYCISCELDYVLIRYISKKLGSNFSFCYHYPNLIVHLF